MSVNPDRCSRVAGGLKAIRLKLALNFRPMPLEPIATRRIPNAIILVFRGAQ
jgi:hypothetical protein